MGGGSTSHPSPCRQTGHLAGLLVLGITILLAREIGVIGFIFAIISYYVVSATVEWFLEEREKKKKKSKKRKKRKISKTELSLVTFIIIAVVGLFFVLPFITLVDPAIILIGIVIVLIIAAVATAELI